MEVRDEDAVPVTTGEEVVHAGHVDHGSTFDAVFVSCVKADVVLDIEFP